MNKITKTRGVRALIASGIAGAGLVAVSMGGSPASALKYPCYYPVPQDNVARFVQDCSTATRPEITTTTVEATTTTEAPTTTATTRPSTPTTTAPSQPTTTMAPGSSTTTTAPGGVGGVGGARPPAARPIAAQASYAG